MTAAPPGPGRSPHRFITRHHDAIIGEFGAFARTLIPPDSDMTEAELRDHAKDMLTASQVLAEFRALRASVSGCTSGPAIRISGD